MDIPADEVHGLHPPILPDACVGKFLWDLKLAARKGKHRGLWRVGPWTVQDLDEINKASVDPSCQKNCRYLRKKYKHSGYSIAWRGNRTPSSKQDGKRKSIVIFPACWWYMESVRRNLYNQSQDPWLRKPFPMSPQLSSSANKSNATPDHYRMHYYKGKSYKITVHLHCLIPIKLVI